MLNQMRSKIPTFSFSTEKWQYIILGILAFFACFYGLSSYAILDMNEGLYAEVAREMLANNHWIIPHLNGVPYLEKPPLLYWLIALSYKIFGVNEFAARLVPSLSFMFTALITFYFAKRLETPRVGFIAAVILLSSIVFMLIGRTVFFDMLLTFLICGCLFYFYLGNIYISYIFLALAVLTKGFLVVILLPAIMLIYLLITKAPREEYIKLFNKRALILFLIIMLPWHIIAAGVYPKFIWEYIINNQLLRFFNMRIPHDYHTGPIYYYIPRVIAYLLPWTEFLPFLIKKHFDQLEKFLLIWFLVMFVFFSLSGDKGDYYMVIGMVPIGYLIALKIDQWFSERQTKYLQYGLYLILILLITAGIGSMILGQQILPILKSGITYLLLAYIIYTAAAFYLCRKNPESPIVPFLLMAGIVIPALMFYLHMRESTQYLYSQKSIANYVKSQYEHRPIYLYKDFEAISSVVFYNQEPSIVIDTQSSDLYFGSHTDEGKDKFISLPDFLKISSQQHVYIAMKPNKLDEFQKTAGKDMFCVVQRNGNALLLSNAPDDCHATLEEGEKKDVNINFDSLIKKGPAQMPENK